MTNSCCVENCHNRQNREKDRKYYSIPFVVHGKGQDTENITTRRRRAWISQLRLKNFSFKSTARRHVCSDHFVNGQAATLWDVKSPSWMPTLRLGSGREGPISRQHEPNTDSDRPGTLTPTPTAPTPGVCTQTMESYAPRIMTPEDEKLHFDGGTRPVKESPLPPPAGGSQPIRSAQRRGKRKRMGSTSANKDHKKIPHVESEMGAQSSDTGTPTLPDESCFKAFLDKMLAKQELIKSELRQQRNEIAGLKNQIWRLEDAVQAGAKKVDESRTDLPEGYVFPLDSITDIKRLDRDLCDVAIRKQLERHLSSLGGANFFASLQAAGDALMSARLQGFYSMKGISSKTETNKAVFFKLTNIQWALYNAIRERHAVDQQHFYSYVSGWLSSWRDRMGGGKQENAGELPICMDDGGKGSTLAS